MDMADVYAGGRSEEMICLSNAERKLRDQIVVALRPVSPQVRTCIGVAMERSISTRRSKAR